jgi:hypothetical protein
MKHGLLHTLHVLLMPSVGSVYLALRRMLSSSSNTQTAPLVSHRFRYTRESYTPQLATVDTRYVIQLARVKPVGNILGRSQQGQVLEPQVCLLLLSVPKLPGMNHLVRQSNACTYETNRVLNTDAPYRRIHKQTYKL